MRNQNIEKLVLSLPADCPYLAAVRNRFFPRQQTLEPADCLVYAMRDPAFEYHFVMAYVRANRRLPVQVTSWSAWRLYSLLRYVGRGIATDFAGLKARALAHPSNRSIQAKLKGLFCACKTYDEAAKWAGIPVEVVEPYGRWHFDFISRRDDGDFVAAVLNPKTELNLLPRERTPDPMLFLMNLGYRQGPEAVVRVHGTGEEWNGEDKGGKTANIRQVLLTDVETKARMRMLDAGDPDYIYFKGLSVVEAKQQSPFESVDDKMGFGRISASRSCQMVIKQVTQAGASEKLRYAREFDARDAAAMEAKKRAAENAAVGADDAAQKAT